jgi:hypothetical protein
MKPTPRPGRPISEMGGRIQDLMDLGWSAIKIAHHCGCDKNTIITVLRDPNSDPRFVTGELLIELHEHVMKGESKWARMIRELVVYHRMTFREIANQCGVTVNYLRYGFIYNHKKMPRYKLGAALTRLHNAKEAQCNVPKEPAPPAYVKFMQGVTRELER